MIKRLLPFLAAVAFVNAGVVRVEVSDRSDIPVAGYEKVTGKVHFAVDPKLAANQIITDIDRAPRNAQGLVEFAADLYVLRPKDRSKGNGTALLEISNRGGRGLLGMFDLASANDPYGDKLLFDQGYTLVWIGWEWDVPQNPDLIKLYAPVIRGLTGTVRSEIVVDRKVTSASLGDRAQLPYAIADSDSATLTVRDRINSARTTIPKSDWKFTPDGERVEYPHGFEPGKLYEVVYTGKDPAVVGLGPAAVRDYASYIKENGEVQRVIGFGTSQSGRFLRTFLYYGFNADERGRKVFDGVWAHVAGAGRGSFDHRFAQPSRDGHPLLNLLYPTDLFPFTDEAETDQGQTDGLLARAEKDHAAPKIFYTDGSYEYWGRAASLIHTSVDGQKDIAPRPDTRIYYIAGTQHGANANPVRTVTQNLPNPTDYRFAMRSLLQQMNSWVTDGTAPPDSRIPRIGKDELVAPSALAFPKIPGVAVPKESYVALRLDFGPDFRSKGVVTQDPPKVGAPYPIRVPQVNTDGNETEGIRLPEIAVPLATYTGWNLRDPKAGSPDVIYNMVGSMIPFARTKAEREKSGDPRPSIEERYGTREDYLKKVRAAAEPLVDQHLLLQRDVDRVVAKAGDRWDFIMNSK